jgi:hypothetical protein
MASMFEVDKLKSFENLIGVYKSAFEKRYNCEPYLSDHDKEVIRWIRNAFEEKKGTDILVHFLEMNDEWFLKQSHGLVCLKNNVNKVLAFIGSSKRNRTAFISKRLEMIVSCDKCYQTFIFTPTVKEFSTDNPMLCDNCN